MKLVEVQVPSEAAERVRRLADEHGAFAPSEIDIRRDGEAGWSTLRVNLPNDRVGPFVTATAEAVEAAELVIETAETLPIRPPLSDVRERVTDVSRRSTLELVLAVHQSVGTWPAMLFFAAVSGLVAAYGVIFGLPYLLTGAMLIAPLGSPVMVCVVGAAVGDRWMVRRGVVRFAGALAAVAAAGAALGWLYGLSASTAMMETISDLSLWSALLGVAGGAAGALTLVKSERDSLVTATATGFLVAVSLSPPSAVLGLGVALGRWHTVGLMAFLLALTFVGILLGGFLALRARGVRPGETTIGRGEPRFAHALAATAAVALAALVLWQAHAGASWQRADLARRASTLARQAMSDVPGYAVLRAEASFTTANAEWHAGESMLLDLVLKRRPEAGEAVPEAALRSVVRDAIERELDGVRTFVDLTTVP